MRCLGLLSLLLLAFSVSAKPFMLYDTDKPFIDNMVQLVRNIAKWLYGLISKILPVAESVFELNIHSITSYPFELVADVINDICSTILQYDYMPRTFEPDIKDMQFQLRSECEIESFPLTNATSMWHSRNFHSEKKVVVLATGWHTAVNSSETVYSFEKAFNCRGDVNFVVLDAASYIKTIYNWAAMNTEEIGAHIATALVQLANMEPHNIHLIGHSLGAHIVGAAGRHFHKLTGLKIPRITGLDPAKPCFREGEHLNGLNRGDADYVDIIHSNPGVFGKREALGDVDFYPGGKSALPSGCTSLVTAHELAWRYFVETIYPGQTYNFLARRCNSLSQMRSGFCAGNTVPMGYELPHRYYGNYYLETRPKSPYGLNVSLEKWHRLRNCGKCARLIETTATTTTTASGSWFGFW